MCSLGSVRLCVFMKIYFVTHEMCRKREREREREANNLFYFLPLNRFQLLFFNLERDILSFSYSHRTVINWTLVASKGTVIESTRTKCVNLNLLYLKNRLCCHVKENESIEVSKLTNQIQVDQFEINESILLIFNYHSNLDLLCAKDPKMCACLFWGNR